MFTLGFVVMLAIMAGFLFAVRGAATDGIGEAIVTAFAGSAAATSVRMTGFRDLTYAQPAHPGACSQE